MKIGLKEIGKHIDSIIDDATPEEMRIISAWLESKANFVKCAADIEEAFNRKTIGHDKKEIDVIIAEDKK